MKGRWAAALGFALAWIVLAGAPTPGNVLLGALVGFGVAAVLPAPAKPRRSASVRVVPALALLLRFLWEVALSGWRVARLVLSPRLRMRPALFELPLRLEGAGQIALLANMITLTPGTLTVDMGAEGRTLIIHALDAPDVEAATREIVEGFERMIIEAFGR